MAQRPNIDFSADRPIESRDADLLNRIGFADHVAAAVRGWTGRDSLVLGLYGDWGSGKSSLKNMVVESLKSGEGSSCPYVVEFNPWQWAGQEQLALAFFREIGKELGRKEGSKEAKESARRWRKYGAFLGVGAEIFAATRRLTLCALGVLTLLGIAAAAFFEFLLVRTALVVIASLSFIGFVLLKTSDRIANAVATYLTRVAEADAKSLDEVKSELSHALLALNRPLLVVMDDVDRLTGPETRLLFQLIKANANFPNMVYLVLFQRETVEAVLSELSVDGREYLKKIVQVGFNVPHIHSSKLDAILSSKLDALLQGESVQRLWESERWPDVFIPGLKPYFETLRDVYRFVSVLSVQFAVFSGGSSFEVNPIDLIALEALRVFEPEVYNALPASKDTLTRVESIGSSRSQTEATKKDEIRALVQKVPEDRRKRVQEILTQVFPPVSWAFDGLRYSSDHWDSWYRAHRACHPDVFDKYFHLTIAEGELSHEEVERIVGLAGDRQALAAALRSTGKRNLLDVAIDRLESYKETTSLDHAIPFITALFDIGDELPIGRLGLSDVPPDLHAARIIYWYLKREQKIARRQEILGDCIKQTTGIYLPCFVVALEGDKVKEGRKEQERLADDAGVKHLKELCISKIREAASNGTLSDHARLGQLIGLWLEWSSPGEAQAWVKSLIDSRDGLLKFLMTSLREGRSYGFSRYVGRPVWNVDLAGIEKFVEPESIEHRLAEITIEDLEGRQRQAVEVFQRAMKRKREGKPPNSILDDDLEDTGG